MYNSFFRSDLNSKSFKESAESLIGVTAELKALAESSGIKMDFSDFIKSK